MRYDAFISYSHAADDALAPAVQHGLQSLARRWTQRRALEVFRDDTGLAVSPGLWSSIAEALDESDFFVLLASPEAASSKWVNQEIDHWTASHPVDRLLPVLTAGEWVWDAQAGDFNWTRSTAVPAALHGLFREEPRHLDLRWARSETELDLRNSRFREAIAQLAAPMHGITPEDLESADVTNHRHLVRLRRAVVAALAALLVLVSVAGVVAVRNAREARQQQDLAEKNARDAEQEKDHALALQLVAQADVLRDEQKSLSLLLGLEATRLEPVETWGSLIDGLQATPGLLKVFDAPPGVDVATDPVAVDPAVRLLATPSGGSSIRLWDLASRRPVNGQLDRRSSLFPKSAADLAFSTSGMLVGFYVCARSKAACVERELQKAIFVWDPEQRTGRLMRGSRDFAEPSADDAGDLVAAAAVDGRLSVWDTATGEVVTERHLPRRARAGVVVLSRAGDLLAVGDERSDRVFVYRLHGSSPAAKAVLRLGDGHTAVQLGFGRGDLLVSRRDDGIVQLWDASKGKVRGRLKGSSGSPVTEVAVDFRGTLATATADGLIRLYDANTRAPLGLPHQSGLAGPGVRLVFAREGDLVSIGSDIRLWDVGTWQGTGSRLYRQTGRVTGLDVNASGAMVSSDDDGDLAVSTLDGRASDVRMVSTGESAVAALALSDDGTIATGGPNGTVRLWDHASGRPTGVELPGDGDAVTALAFSPDGRTLAVGYQRPPGRRPPPTWHDLRVWDVDTGRIVGQLDAGLAGNVAALAFSPDGLLASAGSDHLSFGDDLDRWPSKVANPWAKGHYSAVTFSPDGQTLTGSGYVKGLEKDRTVGLWDVDFSDPRSVIMLEAPTVTGWDGRFADLAYSPDGSILVGAGKAGLQLWDMGQGGTPLGGLVGPPGAAAVEVSPDGYVVAGYRDGTVEAYPATLDGWRQATCAVLSRNLTQDEWVALFDKDASYQKSCPQYPSR